MMNTLTQSLRRILAQPAFVVVATVLLVAAVGLNTTTNYMQLHFKKLPVPLARPLNEVSDRLGHWEQVSIDEALDAEMQDTLGTEKYVFRDYVDTRLISPKDLADLKQVVRDKLPNQRRQVMYAFQNEHPGAVINLGLTYYTGLVDTVAHIPDRCYIADGFEPSSYTTPSWSALTGRPGDQKVRYIVFEDQTPGRQSVAKNVAYFFHCNGEYVSDPIGVRKNLANLFQRYGYYMKIEVQTIKLTPDESARVMNDFLSDLLPEVEKALPDFAKLSSATR
jgi:hypothetical protein